MKKGCTLPLEMVILLIALVISFVFGILLLGGTGEGGFSFSNLGKGLIDFIFG